MLSADEREAAVDRVLGELRTLLVRAPDRERYGVGASKQTDRRAVARARMHLDTAAEQLDRAIEYVSLLEDRLET
jgi:hypothetical protein